MNTVGLAITLVAGIFMLVLPRRLVMIPFFMGILYVTRAPVLVLEPAHFTLVQVLVLIGILRAMLKGEQITGGLNGVDIFLTLWALWLIGSCIFHTSNAWVLRFGIVWSQLGSYFLCRIFIQDERDVKHIFKALCIILIPVALLMIVEKNMGKNFFSLLAGESERVDFRHGHFRARGPFAHAILAGTVGATCFPMALYMWEKHKKYALAGLFSTASIIIASTSSGPVMMTFFILCGLALWKFHAYLPLIRWGAIAAVIGLDIAMKDPVYFLMARIDISGGSQGWFRAKLIQSSIEHLDEWWIVGTDYTRHWMSTGITASSLVTDITNHFLWMGVMGGVPLMFFFIMVLAIAFNTVSRMMRENAGGGIAYRFLAWTLGATLFGHIWNFFTITLYDQSVVFLYLILACIGAIRTMQPYADVEVKKPARGMTLSRYAKAGQKAAPTAASLETIPLGSGSLHGSNGEYRIYKFSVQEPTRRVKPS
jgi:hypothetical protein